MSYLFASLYSSGSYLCEIVQNLFNKLSFNSAKKCESPINEVLIYGDNDEGKSRQMGLNNLFCVYYVIIHASRSVDVCVPSLVNATLIKCLLNVRQKNKVNIRIVVHKSKNSKDLEVFTQNGIEVKVIERNEIERLEHNFILIDAVDDPVDAVAILGSIDYETSRLNCNRDTTLLTSQEIVVNSLKQEFERVWCNA
ncbi:hypothetical protein K1T71_001834 [Dendrolimus kikuchii]|uniref:Uncharacterized protein n=1 Tax=Dendrolimus kikuchii TaxID=765133 RepID=A0ACC1DF86_9NEOP|nr:hypothetical protein K1T71_001834 [Dendrolimus kikuchii]